MQNYVSVIFTRCWRSMTSHDDAGEILRSLTRRGYGLLEHGYVRSPKQAVSLEIWKFTSLSKICGITGFSVNWDLRYIYFSRHNTFHKGTTRVPKFI